MKKRIIIIILVTIVILLILIGIMMFTNLGQNIRSDLYYNFGIPKETIIVSEPENIKVTYTYPMSAESFDVDISDKEVINLVVESISNKKLNNETKAGIMLAIMGEYTVDLGNNISFKFDDFYDGYIKISNNGDQFITQISTTPLEKIQDIVDVKLTEKVQMFQTEKITVTNIDNKKVDFERKAAIEYILNQCKGIYTKEVEKGVILDIAKADYRINFNNGVEIFKYNDNDTDQGFITIDNKNYYVYRLSVLDTILENAYNDLEEKEKMFNADKIVITNPDKSIEITDQAIINKITTSLIYSDIQERDWLKDHNITTEYNNGTKVKINDYEFLIPGKIDDITVGNRYVISKDKLIRLCFPLYNIEDEINKSLKGEIESNERIVMVNDKLYYDTKMESETIGRCGTMDGHIASYVASDREPTINNQSNFEGDYGYQYGSNNTIEICINGKWIIFATKTYTRTYTIENIKHGQEENSYYLTLSKFQGETDTVLVKDFEQKLENGKYYEFTFAKKNSLKSIEDNIESIFENSDIIEIKETDKVGMGQIQEPII